MKITDYRLVTLELSSIIYLEYMQKYPKLIKWLLGNIIVDFLNAELTEAESFDSKYEELKWDTYITFKETGEYPETVEVLPDIFDDLYNTLKYELYPGCILGNGSKTLKFLSMQQERVRFLVEVVPYEFKNRNDVGRFHDGCSR